MASEYPWDQIVFFARLQREGLWTKTDQEAAEELLETFYDMDAQGESVGTEIDTLEDIVKTGRLQLRTRVRVSPKKAIRKRRYRGQKVYRTTLWSPFDPRAWRSGTQADLRLSRQQAVSAALAARWLDKTGGKLTAITTQEHAELSHAYKRAGNLLTELPRVTQLYVLMHMMSKHNITDHEALAAQLNQPGLRELVAHPRLHQAVARVAEATRQHRL